MPRITLALATVLSLAFTPVAAQDWQKAMTAFENGDFAAALQEWLPLAEQGIAGPQVMLGMMYDKGLGTQRDYTKALLWYRLAADQGVAEAQTALGLKHLTGQGVLQDYALAVKWFRSAAVQGEATAQNNLAAMYEDGLSLIQDNVMAHMWYNIASANGHDKAGGHRDERAGLMTPADISKAQGMARECMSSGYTKCGY